MPKDLRVSLVIPVRYEAATISDLLTSIRSQIARKYLLALVIVILAAVHNRVWLFVLGFAAIA